MILPIAKSISKVKAQLRKKALKVVYSSLVRYSKPASSLWWTPSLGQDRDYIKSGPYSPKGIW